MAAVPEAARRSAGCVRALARRHPEMLGASCSCRTGSVSAGLALLLLNSSEKRVKQTSPEERPRRRASSRWFSPAASPSPMPRGRAVLPLGRSLLLAHE